MPMAARGVPTNGLRSFRARQFRVALLNASHAALRASPAAAIRYAPDTRMRERRGTARVRPVHDRSPRDAVAPAPARTHVSVHPLNWVRRLPTTKDSTRECRGPHIAAPLYHTTNFVTTS